MRKLEVLLKGEQQKTRSLEDKIKEQQEKIQEQQEKIQELDEDAKRFSKVNLDLSERLLALLSSSNAQHNTEMKSTKCLRIPSTS